MPKSRHHKRKNKPQSLFFNPSKELKRIDELIEAGDTAEALEQLKSLASRMPQRVEIFETMFMLAVELDDKCTLLETAIRLAELQPNVPAHHFNLYGVYLQNFFPALALQTGRKFLSRWPDVELGKDMRQDIEKILPHLREEAIRQQFGDDEAWLEHLALHERVQVALSRNRFEESQRLAAELISILPNFVPAYNNRSLAFFMNGQFDEAIADARRALEIDPGNVHALGNLTRFFRLANRLTEACEIAERLKAANSPGLDVWTKKAEAFSYLCDDAAVLQVAEQADRAGMLFGKAADPVLLHLAGVAAARLGDEKKARKFWKEATKLEPSLSRAQANLEDLDKPPGERDGAWPFELPDWLSRRRFEDFAEIVGQSIEAKNMKNLQGATQRYVEKHPQVMALTPVLFERGDPFGREFALRLAQMLETPEAIAMIKEFVHSPHGPDKLRQNALQVLQNLKVVETSAKLDFWSRGRQTEILAMNWQVDDVPYDTLKLPAGAMELLGAGLKAMRRNEWDRAEKLFSQALAMAPDSVSLRFNLATAAANQGKIAKAVEDMKTLAEHHPKYVFVHNQLALHALANGRIEEARERLKTVFALEHFHIDEFMNFCQAQIMFFIIGDPNPEAASHWLRMWEQLAPDHPNLDLFRPLVKNAAFSRLQAMSLIEWLREEALPR
jgi:tetratricopeptide (TPR) repeat protein